MAVMIAATMLGGTASAQKGNALPGQNFYFNDYEWPLPAERTTTMTLNGMKSVHAVIMSFTRYTDTNPVQDQPNLTILEGSAVRWTPPQGCPYELQLVNSNPPVINMTKVPGMCNLKTGAKVIFRVLAIQ
jgi:hypothetical protein